MLEPPHRYRGLSDQYWVTGIRANRLRALAYLLIRDGSTSARGATLGRAAMRRRPTARRSVACGSGGRRLVTGAAVTKGIKFGLLSGMAGIMCCVPSPRGVVLVHESRARRIATAAEAVRSGPGGHHRHSVLRLRLNFVLPCLRPGRRGDRGGPVPAGILRRGMCTLAGARTDRGGCLPSWSWPASAPTSGCSGPALAISKYLGIWFG